MLRLTLTVPARDNASAPLDRLHAEVRAQLQTAFDGFTALTGDGYWNGPHAGSEPVTVYTVDTDAPWARRAIRTIAQYVKTTAKQDAVYVTAQTIETELI